MLPRSPVIRLSIAITVNPSFINLSHKCDPKNPAAPVIKTRFDAILNYFDAAADAGTAGALPILS